MDCTRAGKGKAMTDKQIRARLTPTVGGGGSVEFYFVHTTEPKDMAAFNETLHWLFSTNEVSTRYRKDIENE